MSLIAAACGPITEQDARRVLNSGREIQRIEDEEIRPRLAELDKLELEEIQPRELRLEEIEREIQALYEELIQPLEMEGYETEPHPDTVAVIREEFEAAFYELEQKLRDLEREAQELEYDFQDAERSLFDEQNDTARAVEDEMYALDRKIDDLYRAQQDEIDALLDQIHDLEQGGYTGDYTGVDNQGAIYEEIEALYSKINDIEQSYHLQIEELEAQKLPLYEEIEAFYATHNNSPAHVTIADLEAELDAMHFRIEDLYASEEAETAYYLDSIAALHAELELAEPGTADSAAIEEEIASLQAQLDAIYASYDDQVAAIEADKLALQDELNALYADHESDPDHLAIADSELQVQEIEGQLEDIYVAIDTETAYLYDKIAALEAGLDGSAGGDYQSDQTDKELAALYEQIEGAERYYSSQIDELEARRLDLEEEQRLVYRDYDDEFRRLQDEFAQQMDAIEDRRFELEQARWDLEDEIREEMIAAEDMFNDHRGEIEAEIQVIYDEHIAPLEAEARLLWDELDELYAHRSAVQAELRTVRNQIGEQERLLEGALLDVLETAINTLAEEDVASADDKPGLGFGRDYSASGFEPDFESLFPSLELYDDGSEPDDGTTGSGEDAQPADDGTADDPSTVPYDELTPVP